MTLKRMAARAKGGIYVDCAHTHFFRVADRCKYTSRIYATRELITLLCREKMRDPSHKLLRKMWVPRKVTLKY